MKSRKLFGYFLMIIGTIIPLYLAANMSLNILSQEKRHQEFNASYKELSSEELNKRVSETTKYNSKLKGDNLAVDPFASEDYEVEYKISDDQDAIFAFIKIPSIDVSEPIYLGATDKHLISGFAHVDGTSLPVGGIGSRSVIAGHRGGYYGRLDLLNAHKINKGDILSIDLGEKKLEYKMVSREIINPADWERLKPDNNKDMITLLTCDPFPTAQNRMLVNFERVVQEVE